MLIKDQFPQEGHKTYFNQKHQAPAYSMGDLVLKNNARQQNHKGGQAGTSLDSTTWNPRSQRKWHNQTERSQGTNKHDQHQAL